MAKAKSVIVSLNGVVLRKQPNPKGTFSLLLDIHHQGQRQREYLGSRFLLTGDREADSQKIRVAKQIAARRAEELNQADYGLAKRPRKGADFMVFFESHLGTKTKPWTNCYKHMKTFLKGRGLQFNLITPKFAEEFKEYLGTKVGSNSARTYYSVFISCLNKAVKKEIIDKNPLAGVSGIKSKKPMREFLTIEEIQVLESTSTDFPVIKNAFLFACFSGLRLSDVKALQWKHVRDEGVQIRQQKTDDPLYLPLANTAKKYLGERGLSEDFVFALSANDEHTRKHLKRWIQSAGITKNISFHNARHSFASMLIEKEVSLYTVQELLGHSEIRHTQVYSHMVSKTKQSAVSKLDA